MVVRSKNITLLEGYKRNNWNQIIIFIMCPIIFSVLIFYYVRNVYKDSKNGGWKSDLLFGILLSIVILVFIFAVIQLVLYKKTLKKEKNNILLSTQFKKLCVIFRILGLPDDEYFSSTKQWEKLIIILKPVVIALLYLLIFLIIGSYNKYFDFLFNSGTIHTPKQVWLLIFFIFFIYAVIKFIIKIPFSIWLYNYSGIGCKYAKIWSIIVGSYWTYKKIIAFNKTEIKDRNKETK